MNDDVSRHVAGLSLAERSELERRLLRRRAATLNDQAIPRRDPGASIPLSFAQQRLWFLDQLHPGRSTYNMARKIRMRGVLDVEALRRAIDGIVARHETLRTTMLAVEGIPQQIIASSLHIPLSVTISVRCRTGRSKRNDSQWRKFGGLSISHAGHSSGLRSFGWSLKSTC